MSETQENIDILDAESISSLHELLQDDFLDILSSFINLMPELIEDLKTLSESKDLNSIAKITHSIKGASGNVGAIYLSNTCESLEFGLRNNSIEEPSPYIDKIEEAASITLNELRDKFFQVSS